MQLYFQIAAWDDFDNNDDNNDSTLALSLSLSLSYGNEVGNEINVRWLVQLKCLWIAKVFFYC